MKYIALVIMTLFIVGCSGAEKYSPPIIPEELKDCNFYKVNDNGFNMRIVRCPNSSTTTSYNTGKSRRNVSVIDEG